MGKDNQSYFLQRAAEEQAAADCAMSPAAAKAHRELALRYSLRTILPDPETRADAIVGVSKPASDQSVRPNRRRARG